MKKLLIIAVALMFVATGVNAQSKAVSDAVKAMTKAKAETENPKKAAAAATWVKLANAYIACYDAPAEGLLPGSPKMQTDLILKGQPALSTEQVEKADAPVYNLAGQRISKMQKGINIVNGQKVLVK